jgi:NADH-quinone oxidoreductase subunit M
MNDHLLSILVGLPLIAAVVVLFMPRQAASSVRHFTVFVMGVELLLSLALLSGEFATSSAYQFVERYPLVEQFGIAYAVGIDGISVWLVLLTTLLTLIATFAAWSSIDTKIKEFAFSFLLLESAMIGAFVALDLFLFYVFWELMLIPMYLIIGIWGGPNRVYAAVKFFLYTMVGSLLMLIAILYMVMQYKALAGHYSFALEDIDRVVVPLSAQLWLFAAFALAFAIKVPMFPFHTWLPDAHVQAPTAGSVILAAVLLKLGGYGFLRFAIPLFPQAAHQLGPTLAILAIVGIIYGAYCAWVQRDVKKLVAYSSVSHLGFVMLGIFSLTLHGVSGSILQMVSHGISTGALFLLVGVIYERRHTRDLNHFGGLARVMPIFATLFVIVAMSSIGLPGTNGFVGEFMILSGSFLSEMLRPFGQVFAILAATGVILAAVYMLHAVLRMFWGPVTHAENEGLPDLYPREALSLAPLIVLIFWIGLFPNVFLSRMEPSVEHFMTAYREKVLIGNGMGPVKEMLLPPAQRTAAAADARPDEQAKTHLTTSTVEADERRSHVGLPQGLVLARIAGPVAGPVAAGQPGAEGGL